MIAATLVVRRIRRAFRRAATAFLCIPLLLAATGCLSEQVLKRSSISEKMAPVGYLAGGDGSLAIVARATYHRPTTYSATGDSPYPPILYGTDPTYVIVSREAIHRLKTRNSCLHPMTYRDEPTGMVWVLGSLEFEDRGNRKVASEQLRFVPPDVPSHGAPLDRLPATFRGAALRGLNEPYEFEQDGEPAVLDLWNLTIQSGRGARTMSPFLIGALYPGAVIVDMVTFGAAAVVAIPLGLAIGIVASPYVVGRGLYQVATSSDWRDPEPADVSRSGLGEPVVRSNSEAQTNPPRLLERPKSPPVHQDYGFMGPPISSTPVPGTEPRP